MFVWQALYQLSHLPSPTHVWTFEMEPVTILNHTPVLLVTGKADGGTLLSGTAEGGCSDS